MTAFGLLQNYAIHVLLNYHAASGNFFSLTILRNIGIAIVNNRIHTSRANRQITADRGKKGRAVCVMKFTLLNLTQIML